MVKKNFAGWVMSAALHVGAVTFAVYGLPMLKHERPAPPPPIAIEFVRIAEKTQVVEPEPEVKVEDVAEQSQPNYAMQENIAPAPAEAVPLLENTPEPVAKPKPKPKPKPDPEKVARERLINKISPRNKPKPPSRFKAKNIAALIDRSKKTETIPTRKTVEPKKTVEKKTKVDPFAGMRGRIATARLVDALSQKLAGCWNFPGGAKGIEEMQVTVRIWLLPDGNLSRPPQYTDAGDLSDGFYRSFAESAKRAVQICAPFTETKDYVRSGRNYIDFKFDGREFGGG